MLSTLPERKRVEPKCLQDLWVPIYNAAVERIDQPDRIQVIPPYHSANRFLTLYMEKAESRVQSAKWWAALDMLVGTISAMMALDIGWHKAPLPSVDGVDIP